jgi:hypothetical protein
MAYNVLKGVVEGSVDQYGDQEIEGVKVFKNTISASVFYDTDAQSPCVTVKDVAITKIKGTVPGSILLRSTDKTAIADSNLVFNGKELSTTTVRARNFIGSAEDLQYLPPDRFSGKITADYLDIGPGLCNVRGTTQLKASDGIKISEDGVTISTAVNSGLSMKSSKLTIDPSKTNSINLQGQNLSDQDILLVSDVSRGSLNHTTLTNLYDNYIKNKISKAAGQKNEIQIKGVSGFASSPSFSYDLDKSTLKVDGKINVENINIEGSLNCAGAIVQNITSISDKSYEIKSDDYTILCDAEKNPITVILPPACNHRGRILNIKKTNTDKYNLRSYPVKLKVSEGTIDFKDELVIKINYSSRTLQSDGTNWWIIGTKGT